MKNNGLKALFPDGYLVGLGIVAALWLVGVYVSDRVSNFLVVTGLLVSSDNPHLFTMPGSPFGMNWRTLGALIGVAMVIGSLIHLVNLITRADPDYEEPKPAKPRPTYAYDDMAPPPGMGMGGDPFGQPPGGGFPSLDFGPPMGGPPMGGPGSPPGF